MKLRNNIEYKEWSENLLYRTLPRNSILCQLPKWKSIDVNKVIICKKSTEVFLENISVNDNDNTVYAIGVFASDKEIKIFIRSEGLELSNLLFYDEIDISSPNMIREIGMKLVRELYSKLPNSKVLTMDEMVEANPNQYILIKDGI